MNTGGPAFPVPDSHHANGQVQYGTNGMTLIDWMAGQETLSDFDHPGENMPLSGAIALAGPQPDGGKGWGPHFIWNAEWRAKMKYMRAAAMLAEKARREADHSEDTLGMIPHREVDNDYWAKFQDDILISFEPTHGWCATIGEGSMGCGNTIAEAVESLRVRWEERSVASGSSPDATKMPDGYIIDENGIPEKPAERHPKQDHSPDAGKMAALEAANRELVEALQGLLDCISETRGKNASDAVMNASAILAKHKGAA